MTDKQTEAMKLALEALEDQRIFTMRPDHEGKELTPAKVTNAIAALREALAERFCDSHCTWLDHHPDCDKAKEPSA